MIGIEGLGHPDLPEHLAGSADLARLGILQHEYVKIARLAVGLAREALVGPLELVDERCPLGRQVGESASRKLGHLVDGAEILARRRPHSVAHRPSASRRMVSADKAARSDKLSVIRNSSMLCILPPRTPMVSTTGTPQAAILFPSHTPPEGCQAIDCPRSAPACLTSLNRASASLVSGLGGRPNPPLSSICTSRSAATAATASSISRFASASISGVRG